MHLAKIRRGLVPVVFCASLLLIGCSTAVVSSATKSGATTVTANVTPTPVAIPTAASKPFPDATRIDAYLSGLTKRGALNGSVLVAYNDMLFSKGYGLADKAAKFPNTPQTRFRIGSVSKQFAALSILILQERGKLHVQDAVCKYVPNCPDDWQPVTIFHLLTHSSGIPDYTNFANFVSTWTRPATPEDLVARFKNQPLDFPPGSVFRYSNSGFVLLGYIIERVSGESYALFLQKNIFDPLGLKNTGYDITHPSLPEHATGYYGGYVKPAAYDPSVFYAAGALYSSVEDLYRWDQSLLLHTLVSQQAIADMTTVQMPCPPSGSGGCLLRTDKGYGYGLFIAQEPQGKLIQHVGRVDGFICYNGFYPQRDLYVVVLSNLEGADVLSIGRTLASIIVKQ